jgi:hypothetical protein
MPLGIATTEPARRSKRLPLRNRSVATVDEHKPLQPLIGKTKHGLRARRQLRNPASADMTAAITVDTLTLHKPAMIFAAATARQHLAPSASRHPGRDVSTRSCLNHLQGILRARCRALPRLLLQSGQHLAGSDHDNATVIELIYSRTDFRADAIPTACVSICDDLQHPDFL